MFHYTNSSRDETKIERRAKLFFTFFSLFVVFFVCLLYFFLSLRYFLLFWRLVFSRSSSLKSPFLLSLRRHFLSFYLLPSFLFFSLIFLHLYFVRLLFPLSLDKVNNIDSRRIRSPRSFASCMFEHRVQGSTGSLDLVCLLLEAAHAAPVNGHGWFKADRRRPPGWTTPGGRRPGLLSSSSFLLVIHRAVFFYTETTKTMNFVPLCSLRPLLDPLRRSELWLGYFFVYQTVWKIECRIWVRFKRVEKDRCRKLVRLGDFEMNLFKIWEKKSRLEFVRISKKK